MVVGDALCSFNPIYGQGMTTGALGARDARSLPARERRGPTGRRSPGSRRFHRRLAGVIDDAVDADDDEDFRSPAARAGARAGSRSLNWYTERVHRLTWRDAFVARRFLEVMHLTTAPRALFHPYIVYRALGARLA